MSIAFPAAANELGREGTLSLEPRVISGAGAPGDAALIPDVKPWANSPGALPTRGLPAGWANGAVCVSSAEDRFGSPAGSGSLPALIHAWGISGDQAGVSEVGTSLRWANAYRPGVMVSTGGWGIIGTTMGE